MYGRIAGIVDDVNMGAAMKSESRVFKDSGLTISVLQSGTDITIVLQGVSDSRSPGGFFESVLEELKPVFEGKRVNVNFRPLEYMNSASIHAVMGWVKTLEAMKVSTTLRFDPEISWQRVNMNGIRAVARGMKYLRVDS